MGLRFKKSVKIAPGVKLNLNKKSASVTLGTKGAHYTVNTKGKKTKSVGIPGSGISYVSSTNDSQSNSSVPLQNTENEKLSPKKGRGCLTAIIIVFIIGGIFYFLGFGNDKPEKITLSVSSKTYNINESVPVILNVDPKDADIENMTCESSGGKFVNNDGKLFFTATQEGDYTLSVACKDIESNTLNITIENKKTMVESNKQEKETTNQIQQPQEKMVWISSNGGKYHSRSSCSAMENPQQITLSEAENMGLTPCKKCH